MSIGGNEMIIDCLTLSNKIREEIRQRIVGYIEKGLPEPKLLVIKVGNDFASDKYVKNKEKACLSVGVSTITQYMPESTTTDELIRAIKGYNTRIDVNGILVQLPLPKHIDEAKVINAISVRKDVDGFTKENVANLWLNEPCVYPCTPRGIIEILDSIGFEYDGKDAVVIGRSNIVGKPIAKMLMDRGCTVTVCHSRTYDKKLYTQEADLIVSAVGKEGLLNRFDLSFDGKKQIIIDVGINRNSEGKVCGDVDKSYYELRNGGYYNIYNDPNFLVTPVPKGVGIMTVTMLLKNTLELYEKQHKL